jgi:hypothetical protein
MAKFRFFFSILIIKKLNMHQNIMFLGKKNSPPKKIKNKNLGFGPHVKTPPQGKKKTERN